jgi:hypothetical protein
MMYIRYHDISRRWAGLGAGWGEINVFGALARYVRTVHGPYTFRTVMQRTSASRSSLGAFAQTISSLLLSQDGDATKSERARIAFATRGQSPHGVCSDQPCR